MVFQGFVTTHTRSRANIKSHRDIGKSSMFSKRTPKEIFVDLCDTQNETSSPKMLHVDVTADRFMTSGHAKRYGSPVSLAPGSPSFLTCSRELSRFPTPGLCTAVTTATDCLSVPPTPTVPSYSIVVTPPRILRTEDFVGLKRLGEGGHGKVFLVQDKITSGLFALKVIEKDGLHISSYARIFEEQMIMKVLEGSERCVTVKGSFQDHENFYILTDFFSGRDLRRRIARGMLSIAVIRRYMSELVLALDELHSRQIIHRDIKPDNILIDHEGHLHIADFGISRIFGRPSGDKPWESLRTWKNAKVDQEKTASRRNRTSSPDMTYTPCGTPGLLPPEVFEHQYSYPVDIWCLGIVFHIMLLGRLPFGLIPRNQRLAEMKERTQKLPVKIGEDEHIHPDAEDLLLKMLEKDPAKRITLEEMKVHPFFQIIDWKKVPNSAHDGSGIPKQMFGGRATANDVHIPVGTAYEPGLVPFPWFEHVSSQMQEVEPTDEGARPTTDPISTLLEADIHDLELPLTEAPVSTKFTRRLKHWWKRKHTMEVKPDTEGECRLLEGLVL